MSNLGSVADMQAALVGDDVEIIDERAVCFHLLCPDSGGGGSRSAAQIAGMSCWTATP
jgi:hypothetical protein